MAGRVDLEAFAGSARKITNFLPEVTGGLKKFYGTRHVAEVEYTNKNRLVPFINKYEPMALLISDGRTGLIHSDTYEEIDIKIPNGIDVSLLEWKQINDRILFVHPDVQPFSIDFHGVDGLGKYKFTTDMASFAEVPYFPIGWQGDYSGPLTFEKVSGSENTYTASITGGLVASIEFPEPLNNSASHTRESQYYNKPEETEDDIPVPTVSLIKVTSSGEQVIVSGAAGSTSKNAWTRKVGTSYVYIGTTFSQTIKRELALKVIQSVLPESTINSGVLEIKDASGKTLSTGDNIYLKITFPEMVIADTVDSPEEEKVSSTQTVSGVLFDNKHLVGRKIKIYTNSNSEVIPWAAEQELDSSNAIRYSNGHYYKAGLIILTDGKKICGTKQPSHTSGIRSDGNISWEYLHSGSTTATILEASSPIQLKVQLTGKSGLPQVKPEEMVFDTFAWSIWGLDGIHPSKIYMVQNRFGLICNTKNFGAWNALSVSDNYFDFSTEEFGQQLDTSAIVHLITNNPDNKINWVLSYNSLYMGSDTNEFSVSAANKVLTPTTLVCNPISSLGGAAVSPIKYKELNLFVGSNKDELYTIGYDYTIEDYVPKSIGYITNHMLGRGILRLESVHNKDQSVYILHETGVLSVLNYVGDQQILAYSNIDSGSKIVDICSTSSAANRRTYFAVERNEGKLSIEYIADKEPTYMWNTFEYSGDEVIEFAIPELANKSVYIVSNGQFFDVTLDSEGHWEFREPTTHYAVGLKMKAELHTQPAFGRKAEGVAQQSVKVSMRLNESGAFKYGDSTNFDHYIDFSNWGTDQIFEEAHNLYTGDAMLDLASGYTMMANKGTGPYPNDTGVGVNIIAETPEPFNLLSITEVYV